MKIGDIVYLESQKEWYKTPNNFNEMIVYPAGTPVKIYWRLVDTEGGM